jgi:glycogen phosphorylase
MSSTLDATPPGPVSTRRERNVTSFKREFLEYLRFTRGSDLSFATPIDLYTALALTVRDYLLERWLDTLHTQAGQPVRFVCYLSAEYLLGRQLGNNLLATDLRELAREALSDLGLDLDALAEVEVEPGLGNGGLGRLAACFLDSLATLAIPSVGYGIRYEFGIFRQRIEDGWQVEQPDEWLSRGVPWEFQQFDLRVEVGFGGHTEWIADEQGRPRARWVPQRTIIGVPYNYLVPGYRNGTVNTLRLWSALATESFDLQVFNAGDYTRAVEDKVRSENLTKVLYPDDTTPQGKRLRLEQQYFFVACSLADALRLLAPLDVDLPALPERVVMQLNDTHPSIAVPELMRLLLDVRGLEWEAAWEVTRRVFAYTCHTLLPEALEKWPVDLFATLLPRHLEIIYEINRRFLEEVESRFPGDGARQARMSIIEEQPVRQVRMAHLATVGSFAVNGVAGLHSRLLRETVLHDFYELWPERFRNKTNGVTPRRFIGLANPGLSELLTARLGAGWMADLDRLEALEGDAGDPQLQDQWRQVKAANKARLADLVAERTGVTIDPASMFDLMFKRLHEYKRQLLNVLHVVTLYQRLQAAPQAAPRAAPRGAPQAGPVAPSVPRTVLFGAKAAPGYRQAKLIIKLINDVAQVVNGDPLTAGRLRVAFLPDFNVTLAERVYPAADLSEQISLAGMEASGTGNMKFALNGAVTIGTLDGANVEIRERVGAENFFLFGMTTEEVAARRAAGYRPRAYYEADEELRRALDAIAGGAFSGGDPSRFAPLVESLLHEDRYMLLADYRPYVEAQAAAAEAYLDPERWTRMSILNCARCGYFSSDRAIREYGEDIWQTRPVPAVPWEGTPRVPVPGARGLRRLRAQGD